MDVDARKAGEVPEPVIGELYMRRSRALGDPDDPDLLAHHRALLLRLAEQDGVHIPPENILQEVGSGERIETRPKFRQKVTEWESGKATARVFYVTELERLSRGSLLEVGRVMEALRHAQVKVRTPGRWYDLSAGDDEFFYALGAILGHRELQRYKERVELKRAEQVRQGLIRTGKVPWGYLWDRNVSGRGVPRPHPERFPILQAMCREVLTESIHRVARRHGVSPSTLQWTLRNAAICGYPVRRHIAGHPQTRRWTRPLPRDCWIWPDQAGDYPAACTRAEWEHIQDVLDARYTLRGKTGFDEDGWAKDVVSFLGCPGRVHLASVKEWRVYERADRKRRQYTVKREEVHAVIFAALQRLFSDPEAVLAAFAAREDAPDAEEATAALNAELARLRAHLDRLTEERLAVEDEEGRASAARVQEKLKGQIRTTAADLRRMQAERAPTTGQEIAAELLAALCHGFATVWPRLQGAEKRALVNGVIERVDVLVEPQPGKQRYRREVREPVFWPWVPQEFGE